MSQEPAVEREAVLAAAHDLLRRAGVTVPPTPLADLLVACALEADEFAFSDPYSELGRPMPLAQARADLRPQVRGMVDVAGRVIYTHRSLGAAQRRFVAFHELGHYVLPWHNSLLQTCSESDLSPAARQTWEREANMFAMACLFQGKDFTAQAQRGRLGWATVRRLARRYESSLEATARQLVISRPEAGLLLVAALESEVDKTNRAASGTPLLQVRYTATSPAWKRRFSAVALPAPGTPLPWTHPATRVMLLGGSDILPIPLAGLLDTQPDLPLQAEFLCNGYEVLMLARAEK